MLKKCGGSAMLLGVLNCEWIGESRLLLHRCEKVV